MSSHTPECYGHHDDQDPQETQEWLDSMAEVLAREGAERVSQLLVQLQQAAYRKGVKIPFSANTPYINSIPAEEQPAYPGNRDLERRIKSIIRWNALAMVSRANHHYEGLGGHISSYASVATLYEVGFNHFFKAKGADFQGDQVFFQGHTAPGVYARAFLEGRLSEDQLTAFRRELSGEKGGLSSYPHPWLMPDFWEFPTVSMGLGPIAALYQARFNKYLHDRGLKDTSQQKVWCFIGDGETDEPETLGALNLAVREKLDNLIFVVNCNLQRLDGPVRGNGKIVQELERAFRGAGWHVIKVLWGGEWDALLKADAGGKLVERMGELVDGQYQRYTVTDGAYIRSHFFNSPGSRSWLRSSRTSRCARSSAAATTLRRSTHLCQGHGQPGRPLGHPGQDRQGLRLGRGRRGPQCDPQHEEAQRAGDQGVPHPLRHPHQRRAGEG